MKKLILALLVSSLFVGCNKDADSSGGAGNYTFKVNGAQVNSNVWNLSYQNLFPAFLTTNATSNMHKDKRAINININAAQTGTYNFVIGSTSTVNTAYGFYYPD